MNGVNPQVATMNAMANGMTNGQQTSPEAIDELKSRLNTSIYDYFLRNQQFELAKMMMDSKMSLKTGKIAPMRRPGVDETGEDTKEDWELKKPGDLPYAEGVPQIMTDNSFLFDWFQIFWEMFFAPRKQNQLKPGPASMAYMQHQKEQQQMMRQHGMPNGAAPAAYQQGMMRAGQPVMGAGRGMAQNPQMRNMNPAQAAQQQQMLLARQQQMQAQMQREGSDVEMTDPAMMAQNQFNGFQGQKNQKANLEAYAANLQRQQTMQQQIMPGQQEMADFYQPGNRMPGGMQPNGQPGNGQQGNHALQDYQMQLMLLEQQNKKRLLMARQEQDQVRPGETPMGGQAGFAPNMSPQGSRSGPSPNPSEQMKRSPPKMGQAGLPGGPNSPMPDPNMHARASPGAMNFQGMEMMQKGPDGMPMQAGMRPPSSHPGFNGVQVTPQQMEAMRVAAQQRGQMPNGHWPQQPGMPGMPQGQPGQQQMGTPQQRNVTMPPPQNVPVQNGNGRPASPAQSAASGTPQPSNKAAPAKKGKAGKDTKKQPQKKGTTAATPSADEPPQTPTPATPITPMHPNSFKDGKTVNGVGPPTAQQQPNGAVPAQIPQGPDPALMQFDAMVGVQSHDPMNDLHFGGMDTGDVLEQFDFDAFLDTGDPTDLTFDNLSYGNFDGLEAGTGDA